MPQVFGLHFCLVFVLLIYFDCVTNFHVILSLFLDKNVETQENIVSYFTPSDTAP